MIISDQSSSKQLKILKYNGFKIRHQQILENFVSEVVEADQKVEVGDLGLVSGQQAYWKTSPFIADKKWQEIFRFGTVLQAVKVRITQTLECPLTKI